jgi:hypothetical protein
MHRELACFAVLCSAASGCYGSDHELGGPAATGGTAAHQDAASDGAIADAPAEGDAGPCAELLNDVEAALTSARACSFSPTNTNECKGTVDGLCCPEHVANPTNDAALAFIAAVEAYQQAGCPLECGACPTQTKAQCASSNTCVVSSG